MNLRAFLLCRFGTVPSTQGLDTKAKELKPKIICNMSLLEFMCTISLVKFMRVVINLYHLLNSKCFMFIRFRITKSTSLNENAQKATLARFALAASADPHGKKRKHRHSGVYVIHMYQD